MCCTIKYFYFALMIISTVLIETIESNQDYYLLDGDDVCMRCPIELNGQSESTPEWSAPLGGGFVMHLCKYGNDSLRVSSTSSQKDQQELENKWTRQLNFHCKGNKLCLYKVNKHYPFEYKCRISDSSLATIKLNVIESLHDLKFHSTSIDYKSQQVELVNNETLIVGCEAVYRYEPNVSVNAYIGDQKMFFLNQTITTRKNGLKTLLGYFQERVNRFMNDKYVKCVAKIEDLPMALMNAVDLVKEKVKEYIISINYLPVCIYPDRYYRTGINKSLKIECPVSEAKPNVHDYKLVAPTLYSSYYLANYTSTQYTPQKAVFYLDIKSHSDIGKYECSPRNRIGTTTCHINVILGVTPEPPQNCGVEFTTLQNKTFALISCTPGFNQGGKFLYMAFYRLNQPYDSGYVKDGNESTNLRLLGKLEIASTSSTETCMFLHPSNETHFYEFVVIQENNYGNSTSVRLQLGHRVTFESQKNGFYCHFISNWFYYLIIISSLVLIFCCFCVYKNCLQSNYR